MSYFLEPDSYGRNKLKTELDLFNNATKSEIKKKLLKSDLSYFIGKSHFDDDE